MQLTSRGALVEGVRRRDAALLEECGSGVLYSALTLISVALLAIRLLVNVVL